MRLCVVCILLFSLANAQTVPDDGGNATVPSTTSVSTTAQSLNDNTTSSTMQATTATVLTTTTTESATTPLSKSEHEPNPISSPTPLTEPPANVSLLELPPPEEPKPFPPEDIAKDREALLLEEIQQEGGNESRFRNLACSYGEWSDWSPCSKTCDEGSKSRVKVLTATEGISNNCDKIVKESESCSSDPCPLPFCEYSDWSEFSECTKTCGDGEKKRTRHPLGPEGGCRPSDPNFPLEHVVDCNLKTCTRIPSCKYAEWSDWGECKGICGTGTKSRIHVLAVIADEDVSHCENTQTEVQDCALDSCEEDLADSDCDYSSWSPWSSCAKSCGVMENFRMRTRTVGQNVTDNSESVLSNCADIAQIEACILTSCNNGSLCKEKPDGAYKHPLMLCSPQILMCVKEEGTFFTCPLGLFYNQERTECDVDENVPDCRYLMRKARLLLKSAPPPTVEEYPFSDILTEFHKGNSSTNETEDPQGATYLHPIARLSRIGSVLAMVTMVILMAACMTRVLLWDVACF